MHQASSQLKGHVTYHYLIIIRDRKNAFEVEAIKRNLQHQLATAQQVMLVGPLT
jgi:hypothetical protein